MCWSVGGGWVDVWMMCWYVGGGWEDMRMNVSVDGRWLGVCMNVCVGRRLVVVWKYGCMFQ